MSEADALVELACRLFQAGRLTLWAAARLAKIRRVDMEGELLQRGIPIYHPTTGDLERDLRALERLGI